MAYFFLRVAFLVAFFAAFARFLAMNVTSFLLFKLTR